MKDWIPIKTRPMTEEEKVAFEREWGVKPDDQEAIAFECPMPEDEQEILITVAWRLGACVQLDTCVAETREDGFTEYALFERGDWEGVTAWMPLPDPFVIVKIEKGEADND